MNNNQIWQAVLGEIELNVSKANFTTWFRNTFIFSFNENQVIICVPNTFTKAWLEKKYHQQIGSALQNVTGFKIKEIIYKVDSGKEARASAIKEIKNPLSNHSFSTISASPSSGFSSGEVRPTNRFGLNSRYVFENFVVGRGNELAYAACQAVAANPGKAYNPLFIYGGVGLGKTHLLQAIGHELSKKTDKIMYVSSERFANDFIQSVKSGNAKNFKDTYRNVDLLLVDDIQFLGGKEGTQEEFFHTFNELHQGNKQIVMTSDRVPKAIPALEKRLSSRLEWGMIAAIGQPDIETRTAILLKKCHEKNYSLSSEVLQYIASNVQSNIRELEGALNRIIAFHEFNNTTPTIESTKNILNDILTSTQTKTLSSKDILEAVSRYYDIHPKDLVGKGRRKELVWPRQITIYLMREEMNSSYPTIGQELGGRDHTTAMHAYNKILKEVKEKENERVIQEIHSIKQLLRDLSNY